MESGLVVIPAFNEGEHIAKVLHAVAQRAPEFDVLVVDDASRDTTAEIMRANAATVVTHPLNVGYGAALQTGYRHALQVDYKVVVQLDADGQHDPESVPKLAEPILSGQLDVALGSRSHPGSSYRMPVLRRLGSRWGNAGNDARAPRRPFDAPRNRSPLLRLQDDSRDLHELDPAAGAARLMEDRKHGSRHPRR